MESAPRPRVIIVGAGVAGSVVASRLAEQCEVVVLEIGRDTAASHDPTLAMNNAVDFDESLYPRGHGLGGGSRVNGLVLAHAPDSYWRSLVGLGLDVFADAPREQEMFTGEPSLGDGVVDRALLTAHPDARPTVLSTRGGVRLTTWDRLSPSPVTVRTATSVTRLRMSGDRAVAVLTSAGDELVADHVVLCSGAIGSAVIAARSGCIENETQLLDHPAYFVPLDGEDLGSSGTTGTTYAGAALYEEDVLTMSINGSVAGSPGLLVGLMTPRSSGRLIVDQHSVTIDRGLLADKDDLRVMTAGMWRAARLLAQQSFSRLSSTIDTVLEDDTWVPLVGNGMWHASGTMPMGVGSSAPVDQSGKLRGTSNVWCMDAAVAPSIAPVPPQATVMVTASLLSRRFLSLVTS